MLIIPSYEIEIVQDSTHKPNKKVKQVELHPVEWDAQLVFKVDNKGKQDAIVPIANILDIQEISETKGRIKKKEDLMVKIVFNTDNLDYWIIIDLEEKYIQEFLDNIKLIKQKEFDDVYWTYRLLTLQNDDGQIKTVDIYPLTPFLAEGEEIIWHNMKTEGIVHKKVIWIEVLTNYRVLQYDYKLHSGTVVLMPGLQDVVVNNQSRRI